MGAENHSSSQDKDKDKYKDQTDTEQEDESDVDKNNTGNNNAGSDQQKHLSDQSEPPGQHAVENPQNNSSVLVTAQHHLPQPLPIAQSAIERISNTRINTSNNSSVSIGDCFDFVARAKEQLLRFDQTENYDRFIEILSTWKERALTWEEVFVDMTLILKDAPDLLDEFIKFLPTHARLELKAMGSIGAGEKNGESD